MSFNWNSETNPQLNLGGGFSNPIPAPGASLNDPKPLPLSSIDGHLNGGISSQTDRGDFNATVGMKSRLHSGTGMDPPNYHGGLSHSSPFGTNSFISGTTNATMDQGALTVGASQQLTSSTSGNISHGLDTGGNHMTGVGFSKQFDNGVNANISHYQDTGGNKVTSMGMSKSINDNFVGNANASYNAKDNSYSGGIGFNLSL
eukprot:gb/GECH01011607.1/.p1 GENE.gb/GECH01011607.1/~~gb/GECH01011607.1/.p1  ORF type:complete len:202 (+),score=14.66 gb/GECH01011607.1/:1-606(+)